MLLIVIPDRELFDDATQQFIKVKGQTLSLEHSLVSISKWESKWHKPFLGKDKKSSEEFIDYIRCMTITQNVEPFIYYAVTKENMEQINSYIENSMTATWFTKRKEGQEPINKEQITSELIYYWMISLDIPFECQRWHINRLLTLIRICNIKNKQPKKQNRRDVLSNNAALNSVRRKELGTTG